MRVRRVGGSCKEISGGGGEGDVAEDFPVAVGLELPDGAVAAVEVRAIGEMDLGVAGFVGEVVIDGERAAADETRGGRTVFVKQLLVAGGDGACALHAVAGRTAIDPVVGIAGDDLIDISRFEAFDPFLIGDIDVVAKIHGEAGRGSGASGKDKSERSG